jgi:hypothetical protein
MITITFKVDTNENGVVVNTNATGIGNQAEAEMTLAIVEGVNLIYDVIIKDRGGTPRSTINPDSRITELGQG